MSASTVHLVLMLRAPRLGTVKTRLARTVGPERALAIYRELADGTAELARISGHQVTACFTPPDAHEEIHAWLGDSFHLAPQCDGDLGARMAAAIARCVREGATRVIVVGTDCPTITLATLDAAVVHLDTADVVFGPARDGGYYLVAVRASHPALFDDVPWSTPDTLAASLSRARDEGLRVALLPRMRDVDTEADWRWYQSARSAGDDVPGHLPPERS